MKKESIIAASALALSLSAVSSMAHGKPKWAKKGDTIVKCKGVAAKGKNDCGANGHGCSGQAKKDADPKEWVYVPEGLCEKLSGGSVVTKVKAK